MKQLTCKNRVSPGALNQRIVIEAENKVSDGGGGFFNGWAEHAQVWAKVLPLRGTEEERGGQRGVRVVMFTIRRRGDITHAMRINWNGFDHNIQDIRDPGPSGAFMEIIGKSGVAI